MAIPLAKGVWDRLRGRDAEEYKRAVEDPYRNVDAAKCSSDAAQQQSISDPYRNAAGSAIGSAREAMSQMRAQDYQQQVTAEIQHMKMEMMRQTGLANMGGGGALGQYPQAQQAMKPPPPTQEEEEAWNVPISMLRDMWEVRFGDEWVNHARLRKESILFRIGQDRLEKLNHLEQRHRAFDGASYQLVK
jgi:Sec-independent protein translocase protein TatA